MLKTELIVRHGILLASACFLACAPPAVAAQSTPCLGPDGIGSAFIGKLRLMYYDPAIDSTAWKAAGSPFATGADIQLVTEPATCQAGVDAYNSYRQLAGTAQITSAYIARIGTTGYVVMTPTDRAGEFYMNYWFDSGWIFKQRLAA